jgi:endonuclease YncB( thermonuclease family)
VRTWLLAASLFLLPPFVIGGAALARVPAELAGYAIVRGGSLLQIQGRIVYLHGIYIPPTGQTCRTRVRPIRCSSRAALALDDKVRGLVRCAVQHQYADGSLSGFCSVDGRSVLDADIDLGAWLIQQGWAVAAPGAPFEYGVLENIARTRGQGVWGFQLDGRSRRWRR